MIKIVTDSASDLTKEYAEKYGIDILRFPITVGERTLHDGDISPEEYYDLIDSTPTMPVHSQITVMDFTEKYREFAEQGFTDVIYVSINSYGSSTYSNAVQAITMFAEECPELSDKIKVHVVDSLSYSATYGYPVIKAAQQAAEGVPAEQIVKELEETFSSAEVYLACYTLRFAKKSGRISAAAAFAGELLGFRPVILLSGKGTKTVAKVRGDANVVPKLADIACDRIEKGTEYCVIGGRDLSHREELAKELKKRFGYPPVPYDFRVHGVISSNSGPDVVAVALFKTHK